MGVGQGYLVGEAGLVLEFLSYGDGTIAGWADVGFGC